ncbi:hypothetical protein DPMN_119411 [Dreissena polymorpha]|uniref:Uncharacterized protein n=1 Tax=Dreissena polymorpha TaxID=45954 RepID=A0A9D4GIS1_DREPO|nr:hypothetical protein DPMN_119411 [Dreissena polymorpha]
MLGKKKGCEAVGNWARSIANHLYYCATSSEGNGDLVVAKWTSIGNHDVTNRHDGHGDLFSRYLDGPIDRQWLNAGMAMFYFVTYIVIYKIDQLIIDSCSHIYFFLYTCTSIKNYTFLN